MLDRNNPHVARSNRPWSAAILAILAINVAVEFTLLAADLGFVGASSWRTLAYLLGAFYSEVAWGNVSYYPGQALVTSITYSFLHGGWLHLLLNMVALCSLGPAIAKSVGTRRFLIAYFACAIGGALAFALLSASPNPMVGASGALFGLLGVQISWGYLERKHYGEGMYEIWRALVILALYNLAFWILLSGGLAWETHLGGFLTGWVIAWIWGRPIYRRRSHQRPD